MRLDFAVIGAQKAGSTSLVDYLRQHPRVFLPTQKEVPYFVRREAYAIGTRYLEPFYREAPEDALLGIAHVHMLSFAEAAGRLQSHNADAKVVVVLRNPIDRAYSAYWHAVRIGREDRSFEEALELEEDRMRGTHEERADFGYFGHGRYAMLLGPYIERFGAEGVKIVLTEELRDSTSDTVRTLISWLGENPSGFGLNVERQSNVASMPRFRRLHSLLMAPKSRLKRLYHTIAPNNLRHRIKQSVTQPLLRRNLRPFNYPRMSDRTRVELRTRFLPHIRELEALLGRDLSGWR